MTSRPDVPFWPRLLSREQAARMWRHDALMAMFGLLLAVVMLGATGVCVALLRMVAP